MQVLCTVSLEVRAQKRAMHTLGQAIRARRLELGLTLAALSVRIGCAKGYLSQIENGRRHHPPSEHLLRHLERELGFEDATLIAIGKWDRVPAEIRSALAAGARCREHTRRLIALVERCGLADAFHSGQLASVIEGLIGSSDGAPDLPQREPSRIPVLNRCGDGLPHEFTDAAHELRSAEEFISVPDVLDPESFALWISGPSMAPDYRAGDIVVFCPARRIVDGSDCLIRLARESATIFSRIYHEHDALGDPCLRLQPVNIAHRARTVRQEDVASLYTALRVVRAVQLADRRSSGQGGHRAR